MKENKAEQLLYQALQDGIEATVSVNGVEFKALLTSIPAAGNSLENSCIELISTSLATLSE